jgi:transcriptional regulator with PAS, ATPase and Fis domain
VSRDEVPTAVNQDREGGALRLVATWNGGVVSRELPESGELTLGRGEGADIVIDDVSVSRQHAKLWSGAQILVEDLGSSNGTWVDGERIAPGAKVAIAPGTLVELGSVLVVLRGPTYRRPAATTRGPSDVIVHDPAMEHLFELVDLAARSKLSVILLGETGVGKDVVASRLHAESPRAAAPFVTINCAALVESLLEAELFGYERGAFTGAAQAKAGLIESAHGGTFFLDEIGELPAATQAKLLRVLESGEVTRIGGLKPREVDVRFVSATNRDLGKMVKAGTFRQDLLFRIDGLSIRIPPLRQRTSEIAPLAELFVERACAEAPRPRLTLSEGAIRKLLAHSWPGNVRELRNVIARSVLLCRTEVIDPEHIHLESAIARDAARPASSGPISGDAERDRILAALAEAGGNQTRAAKALGISRRTLVSRLNELDVPRPRK